MTSIRYRSGTTVGMLIVVGAVFAAFVSQSRTAEAATITVNGSCSLAQAISAVNTKKKVGGCAAGTGGDTIVVPISSTIVVSSPLTIQRSVTIQSSTARRHALIEPSDSSVQPAIFTVSPLAGTAASVAFTDITLIDVTGTTTGIRTVGVNSADKLTLTRCIFSFFGNSGVYATETSVTVSDSYFHDNNAELGAGIRVEGNSNNTVLNVSNSSFLFNNAVDAGGAIYDTASTHSTINNSTFSQNFADVGGALSLNGTFDINASTIANNSASADGGGGSGSAVLNFTLTLIAANNINYNPGLPSDWDFNSTINSLKDSLLGSSFSNDAFGGGGTIHINSIGANSILDVPTDFGAVVNVDAFDLGGDAIDNPPTLGINPTGPAVDAIPTNSTSLTADQRGYARGIDAPGGKGTNKWDIGAVEYDPNAQAESLVSTSTTNGTLSGVSGISGFQPSSGKGIKFVPGATGASSVAFRLPMINGGGAQSIILHVQECPTCGKYQISIGDAGLAEPPSFVSIGTLDFSASTTKNVTTSPLSLAPFDPSGFGEDDVIDIKFTLVSKPSGSGSGALVLDFIKMQ